MFEHNRFGNPLRASAATLTHKSGTVRFQERRGHDLSGRGSPQMAKAELHRSLLLSFGIANDALILDVRDQFICARQQPEKQGGRICLVVSKS